MVLPFSALRCNGNCWFACSAAESHAPEGFGLINDRAVDTGVFWPLLKS